MFCRSNRVYIGLDRQPDDTWLWQDGSPMTYEKWAAGEPSQTNPPKLNCTVVNADLNDWKAKDCNWNWYIMCETLSPVGAY